MLLNQTTTLAMGSAGLGPHTLMRLAMVEWVAQMVQAAGRAAVL
jgi:hypothetical protein